MWLMRYTWKMWSRVQGITNLNGLFDLEHGHVDVVDVERVVDVS